MEGTQLVPACGGVEVLPAVGKAGDVFPLSPWPMREDTALGPVLRQGGQLLTPVLHNM